MFNTCFNPLPGLNLRTLKTSDLPSLKWHGQNAHKYWNNWRLTLILNWSSAWSGLIPVFAVCNFYDRHVIVGHVSLQESMAYTRQCKMAAVPWGWELTRGFVLITWSFWADGFCLRAQLLRPKGTTNQPRGIYGTIYICGPQAHKTSWRTATVTLTLVVWRAWPKQLAA